MFSHLRRRQPPAPPHQAFVLQRHRVRGEWALPGLTKIQTSAKTTLAPWRVLTSHSSAPLRVPLAQTPLRRATSERRPSLDRSVYATPAHECATAQLLRAARRAHVVPRAAAAAAAARRAPPAGAEADEAGSRQEAAAWRRW